MCKLSQLSLERYEFGLQFGVDIPITGPGGSATVRNGWNYDVGSDVPRLKTAVMKIMPTFQENQVVELLEDVVEDGVGMTVGAHGTIVDVYSKPREAYELEFINENGDVLAQLTLSSSQIRPYSVEKKASG